MQHEVHDWPQAANGSLGRPISFLYFCPLQEVSMSNRSQTRGFTIRLNEADHETVTAVASGLGTSAAAFITDALQMRLTEMSATGEIDQILVECERLAREESEKRARVLARTRGTYVEQNPVRVEHLDRGDPGSYQD